MARPRKKNDNPRASMNQLLNKAIELFQEPYDDRDERDASLPSLRTVATALNTTILRTRKLLITAECYSTSISRTVQTLVAEGRSVEEVMAITGLGRASVNSYLPYKNLAFLLDQTTVNADRHRVFRRRVKAVNELQCHMDSPDAEVWLWKAIIAFEGYPFRTSGRGGRESTKFKYEVSRKPGSSGRHYSGANVDGFGNELWIIVDGVKRDKSISRSTVELGYKKARELGVVRGPKILGLPGAGSYLWPVLIRFGVCTAE